MKHEDNLFYLLIFFILATLTVLFVFVELDKRAERKRWHNLEYKERYLKYLQDSIKLYSK